MLHGFADAVGEFVVVEGLLEEIEGSPASAHSPPGDVAMTGEKDDRQV